jgi:hypothetical protein
LSNIDILSFKLLYHLFINPLVFMMKIIHLTFDLVNQMNEFPVLSTKSVIAKVGTATDIVSGAFFFVLVPISQFVSSVWSIAITHTSNDSPTGVLLLDGKYKTRRIGIIQIACRPISE